MKQGTLALSWGPWGGFYVHGGRICLGWVAFTYLPIELDDMAQAYIELEAFKNRIRAIGGRTP